MMFIALFIAFLQGFVKVLHLADEEEHKSSLHSTYSFKASNLVKVTRAICDEGYYFENRIVCGKSVHVNLKINRIRNKQTNRMSERKRQTDK